MRPTALLLTTVAVLAGCQLPVTPWTRFTAYAVPYRTQADFQRRFDAWRGGKAVGWTLTYRANAHSDSSLVLRSEGTSSFGPRLVGTAGTGGEFTPTKAELVTVVQEMLNAKVFDLYDGHYGAYDQGGGLRGPEIKVEVEGMVKQVSFDEDLSASASWEASALQKSSQAITALGIKYINKMKAK